jgi:hypothetical protein
MNFHFLAVLSRVLWRFIEVRKVLAAIEKRA